jgi:hypothetical protein
MFVFVSSLYYDEVYLPAAFVFLSDFHFLSATIES